MDSRYILESKSVRREKEKERVIKPGDGVPSTEMGKSRETMGPVWRGQLRLPWMCSFCHV